MSKNTIRLSAAAVVMCLLGILISCSHEKSIVQNPRLLLDYNLSPTDSTLTSLSEDYRKAIEKMKKQESVKPGVYADYAVSLALALRFDEADTFFDKEMVAYPESQQYVTFLKERMTTVAGRERVRKQRIEDSIERDKALKDAASSDFEFEKVRYPKGSKEYRQQQKEKKQARKAKEKEKKEARKAKAKEKQQIKDERDSQKKVAKEERDSQKKAAKKERDSEKKAAQKERDAQKKAAQQERELKKKAAQQEREQQKKNAQSTREKQKKQQLDKREQRKEQLQREREQKKNKQVATDTLQNNTPADTTFINTDEK